MLRSWSVQAVHSAATRSPRGWLFLDPFFIIFVSFIFESRQCNRAACSTQVASLHVRSTETEASCALET